MKKLFTFLLVFSAFLVLPKKILASGPPNQSNSSYSNPGSSIPSDGITTGTITVHLQDSSGGSVVSDIINLSSSNDSTAVFNNSKTTDSSGNATFTITSKTPGITHVSLTDTTNAATFTDWFNVTFYSAVLGCSGVPAAPVLTSVASNSNNTATLIWTDSANPVSNYLVSYGITAAKYIYGNANIGPQGTTTYTVGSLSANKTYYFVVAASNNCGASSFSNEMSVIVNPIPATPVPTSVATVAPTATSKDVIAPISITPTDGAEAMASPTPEAITGGSSMIKIIAIALIVLGVGILALIIIVRKNMAKKGPKIPQIPLNPPTSQVPPTPQVPPTLPVSPTEGDILQP